jgi:hypothetical protein
MYDLLFGRGVLDHAGAEEEVAGINHSDIGRVRATEFINVSIIVGISLYLDHQEHSNQSSYQYESNRVKHVHIILHSLLMGNQFNNMHLHYHLIISLAASSTSSTSIKSASNVGKISTARGEQCRGNKS